MGASSFRKIPQMKIAKSHGETYVFRQQTIKVIRILQSGTWSLPFHYGYC